MREGGVGGGRKAVSLLFRGAGGKKGKKGSRGPRALTLVQGGKNPSL